MLNRWQRACTLALTLCGLLFAQAAQAVYTQRYQSIINGAIVFTGNTLGLDRSGSTYNPGIDGSLGAFINSDDPVGDPSYTGRPGGNTGFGAYALRLNTSSSTLWQGNKSEATLTLPGGGEVVYAELVWGGNYRVGSFDVSSYLGSSVTFTTPMGSYAVAPDADTMKAVSTGGNGDYYVRSANVTGLVRLGGMGRYAVKGVPASYGNNSTSHAAGWTLVVVYQNATLPTRNLSVFVGSEPQGASPAAVSGFCTPMSGLLKARALVSAIEGDARYGGDKFLFGPTSALTDSHRLSGPNNPPNNFFAAQINNSNGALDTSGTLGTRNHTSITDTGATRNSGARIGWDITNVDASANMVYGQTSAFAQGTTTQDQYVISTLALQIDLSAPRFNTSNAVTVNRSATYVGDEVTYTVNLQNIGGSPADNVVVKSQIPAGMSFVAGSATVDGVAAPSATLPSPGIAVGTVNAGATRVVTYRLRVDTMPAAPAPPQYEHQGLWSYDYIPCAGRSREATEAGATAVVVPAVRLAGRKEVSPQGAVPNGATLTYTVTVSNTGVQPSSGTTLQDTLPPGTEYVQGSTRLNGVVVTDDAGGVFPYTSPRQIKSGAVDGVITAGASAVLQFQARVISPALQIINMASYDPDGPDGPIPARQVTAVNSSYTPPGVTKAFSPAAVSAGQTSRLSITLTNNNPGVLTQVAFADVLPAGLSVAATPNVSNTCGGTVTAAPGTIEATLENGTVAANASCVLALNVVTSTTISGDLVNTIPVGAVQSLQANPNNVAAQATLTVREPPLVSKAFSPATILSGQKSRLTVTVINPSSVMLTNVAMTDNLPSGLRVASPANTSNSCSGSLSATPNGTVFSLSGGSIAANGICTYSVDVTATAPAVYRNTIAAGGVTANEGVSVDAAQADLTVAAIQVDKSFGTNPVATKTDSLLTITLINPAPTAITNVNFIDTFPKVGSYAMYAVSGSIATTCGATNAATIQTAGGETTPGVIRLTNGTIPAAGSCTVTVRVRADAGGMYTNTIGVGDVTSANAGSNTVAAEATLAVAQPAVKKAFSPAVIQAGGDSTLTITLSNPTGSNMTGVSFTDNLPTGVTVKTGTSVGGTCSGTKGTNSGRTTVTLAGGAIPSAGCTVTATVTSATAGVYTNIIPENGVTATSPSGARNSEAAQANLIVLEKLKVTKAFDVEQISPGATARLTVTVENPNALDMTDVSVRDVFPTLASPTRSMRIANAGPNAANACGGDLVDSNGNSLEGDDVGVQLTGAVVPAYGVCTFSVDVSTTPTSASGTGVFVNTIPVGNMSGKVEDVTLTGAAPATASLEVKLLPPVVEKRFTASIATTETAELVLKIINPNPYANLSGVSVTDVFPTVPGAMVVATPLSSSNGCGGTVQDSGGGSLGVGDVGIRLNNGAIAANGSCEIKVKVQALVAGSYVNTTGNVAATGTDDGNTASATLTVYAPPSLSKQFAPAEVAVNAPSRLTLTLFNGNPSFPIGGVAFNDVFPAGLVLTDTPEPEMHCTSGSALTATARSGGDGYNFTAGSLAGGGSCAFSVNVKAAVIGDYVNTTTIVTSSNAGTGAAASATLTVKGYSLAGTVYDDRNANSVLDAGDQPMTPSLYVKLASRVGGVCQSPAVQVVQTAADGKYELPGVPDGEYCLLIDNSATPTDLTVTLPAGYAHTEVSGGVRVVTVNAIGQGQLNFGLFRGVSVSGMVFEDNGAGGGVAHNGARDGGEAGLSGVTVALRHASCTGGLCGETLTDSDGRFQLLLSAASTLNGVKLAESNLAGWISVSGNAGNTGGSYALAADELTFNITPGGSYANITFGDVAPPSWVADGQLNIRPNGVVFYPHVFTAKTGGTLRFETVATPAPAFAGWAQLLFVDSNCNGVLDASETAYAAGATIPVNAGQQVCVLLRQTVASNATIGIRNSVVVTAVFSYSSLPPATASRHDNTDLTTVSLLGSGLVLIKQVDKATALPGEQLNYTITYRNGADQPLDNIEIRDVTPAYTTFVSGGCNTPLPQSITACSLSTLPAAGQTGDLVWALTGQLQPGQEGSVRFRVRIDQ